MKFLRYWLPVLAHAAFIFYLSSRSTFPVEPPAIPQLDKLVHACLFGLLALLLLRAITQGRLRNASYKEMLITILLVSFYGMTDEVHQMFVPYRNPCVWDWVADTVGAMLACVGVTGWKKWREAREAAAESPLL